MNHLLTGVWNILTCCEEIQPVLRPAHICLQGCETLEHDPGMYQKCE